MFQQGGSQSEGGFFHDTSMASPNVDKRRDGPRKQQSIGHASIKQIQDCPEENLTIGGNEITLVKIMAKVRGINVTSTKTEYLLEDETGSILGVSWRDGETADEDSEAAPVVENSLCQVVGTLRQTEDKKSLLVLHIGPVHDPNLVTEHLLSITHMRLKAKLMSAGGEGMVNGGAGQASVSGVSNGSAAAGGAQNPNQLILEFISKEGADNESGINKRQVVQQFGGRFSAKQIDDVLGHLCNEGQLYTTVDDDHFKSTD